jgi:transcription elongation factor GreA
VEIAMSEERFPLTQTGYERLKVELTQALAEQQEMTGQLEAIYRDVDRTNDEEAADFEVRTRKEHADERVGHLQYVLARADVMAEDPDPQRINAGDRVIAWDVDSRAEFTFNLVSPAEVGVIEDAVTTDSPVGKALLGRSVGEMIEVDVPDGRERYAIRRVERVER